MRREFESIPTRHSLLSRLKDWNDQESWRVFFETYWKLIYNTAKRAGLHDHEAQDVVQETVIEVSKHIPGFVYDPQKGSFKAWLLRQTTWRIARQFQRRLPVEVSTARPKTSSRTTALERVADPATPALEVLWDEEWEKTLLEAALRRLKTKVDPKQFQIFDLCIRKNWPASKVAKDLEVSTARVYLARHRVGLLLKKEIELLKTKPI